MDQAPVARLTPQQILLFYADRKQFQSIIISIIYGVC